MMSYGIVDVQKYSYLKDLGETQICTLDENLDHVRLLVFCL